MPDQLLEIKTSVPARLLMLLTVLLALLLSWFVVRWFIGNTMAEYMNPEEVRAETAQIAISLAPNDPLPHWRLGNIIQTKLPPDQIPAAVAEYEKAVSLAPNDYRFWMELGRALEQSGESEKAEKALRESVRLAPSYSYPRWYLGNLLLRIDRYDEGFAELRNASETYTELRPQLFNLAWQINKDNFESLQSAVGNTAETRAEFAKYLVARGKFDDGLRFWNSLDDGEKRVNREAGRSIVESLMKNKHFHKAATIWNSIAPGPAYHARIGEIVDPGFEDNVMHGPTNPFGWQVPSVEQVQIGITPTLGHSGSRSLRLLFQVRSNVDYMTVAQPVLVEPNKTYEFECYVKTDKLVSASTPVVGVVDATTGAGLASSSAAPNGDNDWQRIQLTFKTGPNTEAVMLNITRTTCGSENPVCPIFGTVWYDDFSLKSSR